MSDLGAVRSTICTSKLEAVPWLVVAQIKVCNNYAWPMEESPDQLSNIIYKPVLTHTSPTSTSTSTFTSISVSLSLFQNLAAPMTDIQTETSTITDMIHPPDTQ